MDTTTASTIGGADESVFSTGYVSCIQVDGEPILPPIMTEKRREEMRRFKELALKKEKELQAKRKNGSTINASATPKSKLGETYTYSETSFERDLITGQNSKTNEGHSTSTSPKVPTTSTPRIPRVYTVQTEVIPDRKVTQDTYQDTISPVMSPDVREGVLCERIMNVPPLDLNTSTSSAPSGDGNLASSYDGDEDKADAVPSESSDEEKNEENFASATSSTGTYVIRKSSGAGNQHVSSEPASKNVENYCSTSEEEQHTREGPPTVVRKSNIGGDPIFTRKRPRPTKYFDEEENFSSIPNAVPENRKTPTDIHKSLLATNSPSTTKSFSPSPVPVTNFTSLAKSLALEFTKKFCAVGEESSIISGVSATDAGGNMRTSGGTYDVRLSTDIPSSAEKVIKHVEEDSLSNSSDKENIDSNGNGKPHVRKLSYTLATPSAVLLEAVSKDKLFPKNLETVPSAPSSVGVQSENPTPEKYKLQGEGQLGLTNKGVSALGQGKQAHLERFLDEQEGMSQKSKTPDNSPLSSTGGFEDMQKLLKKMQEEHEIQLRRLAEQHRMQELRIRNEFECELEKLKEKYSSTLNSTDSGRSLKTSPNSVIESTVNNSARSPRLDTLYETKSIDFTTSEEPTVNSTRSDRFGNTEMSSVTNSHIMANKNMNVFHFTGSGSGIQSTSAMLSACNVGGGGTMELASVGLSRLQSRMQLMSPKMFRSPADARSPLLKGLVFPDPLEKSNYPLRIPQKALEANMKPKFDRISASVKGYLTRRLLNTEKVQIIVQTVRDTVDLLLKLYEEAPPTGGVPRVRPQDNDLYKRLIQQLTGACRSFHDVFFQLSTKERMAIIATDREKLRAKALKGSPSKRNISNATLKSIERRKSHRPSTTRDTRKVRTSKAYDPLHGSQSVKAKPVKTFIVSPKRRRTSYWDERNEISRSTPALSGKQDLNGNSFKTSTTKTPMSSRSGMGSGRSSQLPPVIGGMGETFIVPSRTAQNSRTTLGVQNTGRSSQIGVSSTRTLASSNQKSNANSARSTQSSVSAASASSGVNRSRASISRNPWNSNR